MNIEIITTAYWLQEFSPFPWRKRLALFEQYFEDPTFLSQMMDSTQLESIRKMVALAFENGTQFLFWRGSGYPKAYLDIEDPPIVLSYQGSFPDESRLALAVVGSRNPSSESLNWLDVHLSQFLKKVPCMVVSGGAFGVDRKAHLVSLRMKTPTLNFLPSGILNPYPKNWEIERKEFLSQGGVFVSEFLPGANVARHHFVRRNRLISGLAQSCLIVDAGRRSGTLLTAKIALEQGRPIFVLPGHAMDIRFQGSLDLMMEGAPFVRDSLDLVQFFKAECLGRTVCVPSLAPCH